MSKTWGILMLSVVSAPSLAETELTHKLCGTSMQTRAWQPLPGVKLGNVDIKADDVELLVLKAPNLPAMLILTPLI